jgi:hypothetical protein
MLETQVYKRLKNGLTLSKCAARPPEATEAALSLPKDEGHTQAKSRRQWVLQGLQCSPAPHRYNQQHRKQLW